MKMQTKAARVERFFNIILKENSEAKVLLKKKRIELRSKRVNSEANFRAIYTCTSISVQTRSLRERWFGNNSLLGGF